MASRAARISHWDGSAVEPDVETPLDGDATADVAIVGGGFTGLSTALHGAARRGSTAWYWKRSASAMAGRGGTSGLVNAGVWHPPAAVRAALGPTYGRALRRALRRRAGVRVFSLIEKHQIRCEPARNGTIHAAHAPSALKGLQGRHDEWRRLGAPVEMLSAEEARGMIGGGRLCRRAP
jgi:glycine/D-amino acid oxidase-like deaminating enzyme